MPKSQSVYHDNGIGRPEEKYIKSDGREAVFDGDTFKPVADPSYMATYNYVSLYGFADSNKKFSDYAKWAGPAVDNIKIF